MTVPNPGTRDARDAGCLCPVLDNNRGLLPPFIATDGQPAWWHTVGCPIHHQPAEENPR